MGKTIYIDQNTMEGAVGIILKQEEKVEVVFTGLEVLAEEAGPITAEFSRLCGVDFLLRGAKPEVPLYAVPYLEIFAADGRGGWFGTPGGSHGPSRPVYYIAPERTACLLSEDSLAWYRTMLSDPDWRQKLLPGTWPRLPEDPEGRRKLADALKLEQVSAPEEQHEAYPLPELFASRAEAERKYPILDIWTVLRDKKEPRFQIHPMMSPQDREGRVFVHYQAWRETYPGLVPDNVLSAHTLERCLERANDRSRSNSAATFVALDRENGDRVVGFGTLHCHARDFVSVPEAGEIGALYVLKDFQGQGIGRGLLEHCLAWIPQPRAALFVLKGNEKAIRFYEHMGFCLTGHEIIQDGMTELEMAREKS